MCPGRCAGGLSSLLDGRTGTYHRFSAAAARLSQESGGRGRHNSAANHQSKQRPLYGLGFIR